MAANNQSVVLIAVLVVLASFGLGYYSTGGATVAVFDFSVKSISFPEVYAGWPIQATAIFSNTGTVSASFVLYRYEILNEQGSVVYSTTDKETLITGKDTSVLLPKVPWLPSGKYVARITLDYNNRFDETNEDNNIFKSEFVVV